jgi:hypothetical protein
VNGRQGNVVPRQRGPVAAGLGVQPHVQQGGRAAARREHGRPPPLGREQEDGGRGVAGYPGRLPAGADDAGGLPLLRRRRRGQWERCRRARLGAAAAGPPPPGRRAARAAAARRGRRPGAGRAVPRRARGRAEAWRGGEVQRPAQEADDQEPGVGSEVPRAEAGECEWVPFPLARCNFLSLVGRDR